MSSFLLTGIGSKADVGEVTAHDIIFWIEMMMNTQVGGAGFDWELLPGSGYEPGQSDRRLQFPSEV